MRSEEHGPSLVTAEEFREVLRVGMPQAIEMGFEIVTLARGRAVLRMATREGDLRPGGTVSGPTLFSLADLAMYAAVMSAVGNAPLAVTSDATIHFLRKPKAGQLVARAKPHQGGQEARGGRRHGGRGGRRGAGDACGDDVCRAGLTVRAFGVKQREPVGAATMRGVVTHRGARHRSLLFCIGAPRSSQRAHRTH
jgi:uncharacterized protein (TIGR00369 family)